MMSGEAALPLPERKSGLAPVTSKDTRLLILGSLPGDRSLAASEYYAHPRNQFWDLIGEVIGTPLRPLPYADRLEVLLEHRIGLWDVVGSAERRGSLDAAMRNMEANPLPALVVSLPMLAGIGFNGQLAFSRGLAVLGPIKDVALIALPSSSPAHAVGIAHKRGAWMTLREVLDPHSSAGPNGGPA